MREEITDQLTIVDRSITDHLYLILTAWKKKKNQLKERSALFTNSKITVHEIISENDITAWRWTWTATHTGQSPSLPIPPTGKDINLAGCNIDLWKEGRIVEEWEYSDYLGFL